MTLSSPTAPLTGSVSVHATGPEGLDAQHTLGEGDTIVLGCSPACGIRLEGGGVAGMHCTISLEQGRLSINDWDTEAGTYVNGNRVARQVIVDPPTEVQICYFRIAISELAGDATDESPAEEAIEEDSLEEETEEGRFSADIESSMANLLNNHHDDGAEAPEEGHSAFGADLTESEPYDRDDYADDTVDLLKAEVEYLRMELAERDARLESLSQRSEPHAGGLDDDLPSREEVEALAGRLEDLLVELEHSDERLKTMSELLRMSDEANVAAEEERTQMESWIGEVERRVRQWEEEWHAERDSLNKTIAELRDQRDHAESQSGDAGQRETIQQLRKEQTATRQQLAAVQKERDALAARLEVADVASIEQRVAAAVDAALREERLQLSQEKAEYARERAHLAQQQDELTFRMDTTKSARDEADVRIRAFREHLKEIRAAEPNARPAPTMSQRLGKLWRKIDGRPLDTD